MSTDKQKTRSIALLVGRHVIHRISLAQSYAGGKWTYATEDRDVILMAVSGAYAMVRRPSCMPYVAPVREIVPNKKVTGPQGSVE